MGLINKEFKERARDRLQSGFWEKLKQESMSYEQILEFVESNFCLDDNSIGTCVHCGDKFEVEKGLSPLVDHLQNNHAGYIIEEK